MATGSADGWVVDRSMLAKSDPWIEPIVDDVHHHVGGDDHQGDDEDRCLNAGEVAPQHGTDELAPDAFAAKDQLHHHGATH